MKRKSKTKQIKAKTFSHACIKPGCENKYEDTDPEAYYCPPCTEQKKAIAAEIDKKLAGRSKEPIMTPLQEYDAAKKVHGFMQVHL